MRVGAWSEETQLTVRARRFSSWRKRELGVAVGVVCLLGAEAGTLLFSPGIAVLALAGVATGMLALDRRLGALGAAFLTVLALPFGRAADIGVFRIDSVPIRPPDVAIAVGVTLALPAFLRTGGRWLKDHHPLEVSRAGLLNAAPTAAILFFLVVGAFALGLGMGQRHDRTDILRDLRWWLLYATLLLALWTPVRRSQLIRGLLAGSALFAALVLVAAVLPPFPGALKDRALTYDWGHLRLQFSNDAFVLAALVYSAFHAVRRRQGAGVHLALVGLFTLAIGLSVTRTSIFAAAAALALAAALGMAPAVHARLWKPSAARMVKIATVAVAAVVLALLILSSPVAERAVPSTYGSSAIERVTFSDPDSDLQAIDAGRFAAYRKAAAMIEESPILGSGMGCLVYLGTTFGNTTAATPGHVPGVDNAYLTIALKSGLVGLLAFMALMLAPVLALARKGRPRLAWYVPAWLGLAALTITQSFATSGYGPFAMALMLGFPVLGTGSASRMTHSAEATMGAWPAK